MTAMAPVARPLARSIARPSLSLCRQAYHTQLSPRPQPAHTRTCSQQSCRLRASTRTGPYPLSTRLVRWRSVGAKETKEAAQYAFEDIKQLSKEPDPDRIIIDVREPHEFAAGYIPTAVNIPVQSAPEALTLPEEDFLDRFGFDKPDPTKEVVFYCKAGVRSTMAARLAEDAGYARRGEYRGSWDDWFGNGGAVGR